MRTLRDKVILITGAGGTVAGAVEAAFRREGAQLVLIDREAVRVTGRAHSFNTPAFEADLSSFGSAQAVVAQAEAQFGRELGDALERRLAAVGLPDDEGAAVRLEEQADPRTHHRVVIDEKQTRLCHVPPYALPYPIAAGFW